MGFRQPSLHVKSCCAVHFTHLVIYLFVDQWRYLRVKSFLCFFSVQSTDCRSSLPVIWNVIYICLNFEAISWAEARFVCSAFIGRRICIRSRRCSALYSPRQSFSIATCSYTVQTELCRQMMLQLASQLSDRVIETNACVVETAEDIVSLPLSGSPYFVFLYFCILIFVLVTFVAVAFANCILQKWWWLDEPVSLV